MIFSYVRTILLRWLHYNDPSNEHLSTSFQIKDLYLGRPCPGLCSGHGRCWKQVCTCDEGFSGNGTQQSLPHYLRLTDRGLDQVTIAQRVRARTWPVSSTRSAPLVPKIRSTNSKNATGETWWGAESSSTSARRVTIGQITSFSSRNLVPVPFKPSKLTAKQYGKPILLLNFGLSVWLTSSLIHSKLWLPLVTSTNLISIVLAISA